MTDFTFFVNTDGGRAAAGYKGSAGDCCCRAVAIACQFLWTERDIATGKPYQLVYDTINELAKQERGYGKKRIRSNARTGVFRPLVPKILDRLGVTWRWTPTMLVGTGCKVHVNADELPSGRLILNLSRHFTCMIDGLIYDTHDPSRDGTRCVYGYWQIYSGDK